jgi:hypothetical protein
MYILIICAWFLRHRLSIGARHRMPQGFSYTISPRCPLSRHDPRHMTPRRLKNMNMNWVCHRIFVVKYYLSHVVAACLWFSTNGCCLGHCNISVLRVQNQWNWTSCNCSFPWTFASIASQDDKLLRRTCSKMTPVGSTGAAGSTSLCRIDLVAWLPTPVRLSSQPSVCVTSPGMLAGVPGSVKDADQCINQNSLIVL